MKKIMSVTLSVILILSVSVINTSAKTSDIDGIIAALNAVEPIKEQMGLSEGIDFEKLTYSDAVTAYEYTNEGPVINSEFIPIKYEDIMIGWVIKTSGEDVYYQFTTEFVAQVNEIADIYTEFAIIYDYNSSYLYDGKQLYALGAVSTPVEGRGILENAEQFENADIIRKSIGGSYALPYDNMKSSGRAQVYFSCNVDYVSQPKGSKLCWAASTACVVNYIKKTNHTAVSVAKRWYGETDYDKTLQHGLQDDVLSRFDVKYIYKIEVPSSGILLNNIQRGYPVQATFSFVDEHKSIRYHEAVIYGMNIMGGFIYIMDPEYGFCSSSYSSSNVYTYVRPDSGITLTVCAATCRYWIP